MKKLITALLLSISFLSINASAENKAADFQLQDIFGVSHTLSSFAGKHVVIEWHNPNCPFVKKFYTPGKMQELQKKWTDKGVIWLTISSTNPEHKDFYNPTEYNVYETDAGYKGSFILLDSDGKVGRLYGAITTPHMFIISPDGEIIYEGAIDSKRSSNSSDIENATNYVDQALSEATMGKEVSTPETRPYGCSVKYAK